LDELSVPSRKRLLWLIATLVFLDFASVGFVGPQTPALIEQLTPASLDYRMLTGVILALGAMLRFLCAPLLGVLSDRFGRRSIFLLSLAGLAAANLMRGLAEGLDVFIAGTIISGVTSATTTVAFAMAADATAPHRRAAAFGFVSAAIGAGFVIGPVLGGLTAATDIRGAFVAAAGIGALAAGIACLGLAETLPPARRSKFTWARVNPLAPLSLLLQNADTARKVIAFFLLESAIALFPGCFALYVGGVFGWGPTHIGFSMGFLAVVFVLAQALVVGPAVHRLGAAGTSMAALGSGMVGFVTLAAAEGDMLVIPAMLGIGLSATAQPSIKAALSDGVSPEAQGELQGSLEAIGAISRIVSPALFGSIYALAASGTGGWINSLPFALTAAALGVAALLMSRRKGAEASCANLRSGVRDA